MSHWKVILATLVIFVAGLVTGTVLTRKLQPPVPTPIPPEVFFQGPVYIQRHFMTRLRQELALTASQSETLEKIFANSRERIRILLDVVGPELRQELDAVHQAIARELTPDQLQKFDDLRRKLRHSRFTGTAAKDRRQRPRDPETGAEPRRGKEPGAAPRGDRKPAPSDPALPALPNRPGPASTY
ncbi:MAG: hypothetical protein JXQ71_06865 [Verrucomicrobia bacterium]|nr:hypothetical protein [Verrucomicrobiota bacterium]